MLKRLNWWFVVNLCTKRRCSQIEPQLKIEKVDGRKATKSLVFNTLLTSKDELLLMTKFLANYIKNDVILVRKNRFGICLKTVVMGWLNSELRFFSALMNKIKWLYQDEGGRTKLGPCSYFTETYRTAF